MSFTATARATPPLARTSTLGGVGIGAASARPAKRRAAALDASTAASTAAAATSVEQHLADAAAALDAADANVRWLLAAAERRINAAEQRAITVEHQRDDAEFRARRLTRRLETLREQYDAVVAERDHYRRQQQQQQQQQQQLLHVDYEQQQQPQRHTADVYWTWPLDDEDGNVSPAAAPSAAAASSSR